MSFVPFIAEFNFLTDPYCNRIDGLYCYREYDTAFLFICYTCIQTSEQLYKVHTYTYTSKELKYMNNISK